MSDENNQKARIRDFYELLDQHNYLNLLQDLFKSEDSMRSSEQVLKRFGISGIIQHIQQNDIKNIICMVGAGISVNSGIPDYRGKDGVHEQEEKMGKPQEEVQITLEYFKQNPQSYYQRSHRLFHGKTFHPTYAHHFINLLHRKGMLLRCWSQNIDSLESKAGLPANKLVAAHGNFDSAYCVSCNKQAELPLEVAAQGKVVFCESCGGPIKPGVIFFGQNLPDRFYDMQDDFQKCDLMLIMGTSLQVYPFAGIVEKVGPNVPRLLINKQLVGQHFFQFHSKQNRRDALFIGDCDAACKRIVEDLGFEPEMEELINQYNNQKGP